MTELKPSQTKTARVELFDAAGNPVPTPTGVAFTIAGDPSLTLAANADGLTAVVTDAGPLGKAVLTAVVAGLTLTEELSAVSGDVTSGKIVVE